VQFTRQTIAPQKLPCMLLLAFGAAWSVLEPHSTHIDQFGF
jgi:hypothetical protein